MAGGESGLGRALAPDGPAQGPPPNLDAGGPRPYGALIHYMLGEGATDVSLSILDSEDNLIRTYEGDALSTDVGLNRMSWGMTYPDVLKG